MLLLGEERGLAKLKTSSESFTKWQLMRLLEKDLVSCMWVFSHLYKREDFLRRTELIEGVGDDLVELVHHPVQLLDLPQHGHLLHDEGLEAGGEGGVVGSLLAGNLLHGRSFLLLELLRLHLIRVKFWLRIKNMPGTSKSLAISSRAFATLTSVLFFFSFLSSLATFSACNFISRRPVLSHLLFQRKPRSFELFCVLLLQMRHLSIVSDNSDKPPWERSNLLQVRHLSALSTFSLGR